MADRVRVIKGLEECLDVLANHVPERFLGYSAGACLDAIAMLIAQEPRLMTLEEALGGEECWVEYPNGGFGYADCYLSYTAKGADIYRTKKHDFNVPLANYGKTWRCWTSRPTDEQREATPWN